MIMHGLTNPALQQAAVVLDSCDGTCSVDSIKNIFALQMVGLKIYSLCKW
jgi:hypothetical protein